MNNAVRAITVYCSSSSAVANAFVNAVRELGRAIALSEWTLVYGGNNVGLMGHLADAVRAGGGKVIGISPQLFIDKGIDDKNCHEFVITECMRTRKAAMEARGDAYIALPGGLGTFEEIFEIIVGKQLGVHNKPIVILNIDNYYDQMLAQLEHGIEQGFIKASARSLFFIASDVDSAIRHIQTYLPPAPADKWFANTTAAQSETSNSIR